MKKKILLFCIVIIPFFTTQASFFYNTCKETEQITKSISSQIRDISKLRVQNNKLTSKQITLLKIKNLKEIKMKKALSLKAKGDIIKVVTINNNKASKVGYLYKDLFRKTNAMRENIQMIKIRAERLTERWKRGNLLKSKKQCLLKIMEKLGEMEKKLNQIHFRSFPHGRLITHNLNIFSTRRSGISAKSEIKADEEKLNAKRWEMLESIADAEIDEAKNNYEESKEQFKLALRILKEHMERMTQVTQKITS